MFLITYVHLRTGINHGFHAQTLTNNDAPPLGRKIDAADSIVNSL